MSHSVSPPRDTIISMVTDRALTHADQPALQTKRSGRYVTTSWGELARDVRRMAAALVSLGIGRGDRVVQLSENRYEWIVSDLAIQMAQAVHVAVHASLTGEQVMTQIADCGARVLIVSTTDQVRKLAPLAHRLPEDVRCLSYEPCGLTLGRARIAPWAEHTAGVADREAELVQRRALTETGPETVTTILYTSGTTGEPRGVVLNQRNLVSNAMATAEAHQRRPDDRLLCILPLSHIFARTCDLYVWIARGNRLALAQSRETVLADCRAVRPTVLNGVPYQYERFYRMWRQSQPDGTLRDLLGGAIRECSCGGAPLTDALFESFHQQGVPLLPGYGLTEAAPVITVSTLAACRRGTVGRAIPGIRLRIAADGEILTSGPHVMVGYWRDPPATRQAVRDDWLHTGDLGHLDSHGFLSITGRKKDLIVTATGNNAMPSRLEHLLCQDPLIDQSLVVGQGRNHLAALIVPDFERLRAELSGQGIGSVPHDQITMHPRVRQVYEQRIARQLAGLSRHEQVRRFALLERRFRVACDEMTSKLSLRRQIIEAHFAREIEALYGP